MKLTTAVQFVPVGSAAAGFIAAFGIKWTMIEGAGSRKSAAESKTKEEQNEGVKT